MNENRENLLNLFLQTSIALLRVLKYRAFLNKTAIPVASDKDIFILGNGPSLKNNLKNNLDILKRKNTFCLNDFCMSDSFNSIKPNYYILLDPVYFRQKNISLTFLALQKNIFNALLEKVSWKMILFIPIITDMHDHWNTLSQQNKNIDIRFINTCSAKGFNKIIFYLYEKNYSMPASQNVLLGAIFLSLNMGYEKIYLLGADHSWTKDLCVNDKNQLYIIDKHFYGEKQTLFYKGNKSKEIWKMHEILSAWSRTFEGYFQLEEYSKYINKRIYNLTPNSYIDAFEKIKYEELF